MLFRRLYYNDTSPLSQTLYYDVTQPSTMTSFYHVSTTVPTPHLDNKHVVFGCVVSGKEIVDTLENQRTDKDNKPLV